MRRRHDTKTLGRGLRRLESTHGGPSDPRIHGTLRTVYRHLSYDGGRYPGSATASDMGNGEGGAGRGKAPRI